MMKKIKILTLICIILLLVTYASGCITEKKATNETAIPDVDVDVEDEEPLELEPAQPKYTIIVNDSYRANYTSWGITGSTIINTTKFFVDVCFANNDDNSVDLYASDFIIRCSDGAEYYGEKGDGMPDAIAPGGNVSFSVIFDVPLEKTPVTLFYIGGKLFLGEPIEVTL